MAYELPGLSLGMYRASTSFASTDQYCFVTLSTTTNNPPDVRIVATSGTQVVGVLQDVPDSSGDSANVCVFGVSKIRFSSTHAAVTVLSPLYSRDDGTANAGTSSSFYVAGYALEPLAADTSGIISMWLNPGLRTGTT